MSALCEVRWRLDEQCIFDKNNNKKRQFVLLLWLLVTVTIITKNPIQKKSKTKLFRSHLTATEELTTLFADIIIVFGVSLSFVKLYLIWWSWWNGCYRRHCCCCCCRYYTNDQNVIHIWTYVNYNTNIFIVIIYYVLCVVLLLNPVICVIVFLHSAWLFGQWFLRQRTSITGVWGVISTRMGRIYQFVFFLHLISFVWVVCTTQDHPNDIFFCITFEDPWPHR